jgi:AIPR protein
MGTARKYTLRLIEARKRPDHQFDGAFQLVGDMEVLDVEAYPLDPNPRKGDKIARSVEADVREALLDPESSFGQKSKGLIIAASSAEAGKKDGSITEYEINMPEAEVTEDDDGHAVLSRYGVLDGRSTMKIILDLQARIRELNEDGADIRHTVPVQIRVGYPAELLEELPGPLNTHAQVQDYTKDNFFGLFDPLKVALGPWQTKVMWEETAYEADDKTIGVRDLLAHLYMFDYKTFTATQPVMGYSSKAKVSVEYRKSMNSEPSSDRFTSLAPLVRDILTLSETIQVEGVELYNKYRRENGSAGAGGSINFIKKKVKPGESKKTGVVDLKPHLFTGKTGHHMDSALLYPMLAAFRAMIQDRPGGPQWIGGFSNVLAVWQTYGGEMMHVAKETLAGQGYNTHAVGRNHGLWTAEYAIVKNAVMQAELDNMRAQLAKQAKATAPA